MKWDGGGWIPNGEWRERDGRQDAWVQSKPSSVWPEKEEHTKRQRPELSQIALEFADCKCIIRPY
jgi:hypothetical protein